MWVCEEPWPGPDEHDRLGWGSVTSNPLADLKDAMERAGHVILNGFENTIKDIIKAFEPLGKIGAGALPPKTGPVLPHRRNDLHAAHSRLPAYSTHHRVRHYSRSSRGER